MKTGHIKTRTAYHVKQTTISTAQYIEDESTKAKHWPQHSSDFDKVVNAYLQAYANPTQTNRNTEIHVEI